MRNLVFLLITVAICFLAILIGTQLHPKGPKKDTASEVVSISKVPHIGRIEVLNGCGVSGAAGAIAGFLRDRSFDVKNTDNADSWNYSETVVISRTTEMDVANQVAEALGIKDVVLLKDGQDLYNVTVIVGSNFGTLIKEEDN